MWRMSHSGTALFLFMPGAKSGGRARWSHPAAFLVAAITFNADPSLLTSISSSSSAWLPPAVLADYKLSEDLNRLKTGLTQLTFLIDNWDAKTTYCNFGEVSRDMLETKNRDVLFKEAAEGSLWEKGENTMNVMCRQDPQVTISTSCFSA